MDDVIMIASMVRDTDAEDEYLAPLYEDLSYKILAIGDNALAQKNYEEAVRQYTMAIDISVPGPKNIFHENRSRAYFEMGLFDECISDCNGALNIGPAGLNLDSQFITAKT